MQWLRTGLKQLYGLFVDDGMFALAIAVWLGVMGALSWSLIQGAGWGGWLLFAGLALILLQSTMWRARR